MDTGCRAVLCTAPDKECARKIAADLLARRLAACVTLLPGAESHYRWQGALEQAEETVMICKTEAASFPALRDAILAIHPYDCPEIVSLPILDGHPAYLQWIRDSVGQPPAAPQPG